MKILNEDYIGKTSNVQKIEDLFTKHSNKKGTIDSLPFVRNEGGIVTKIEDLIKEEFNFEEVVLLFNTDFNSGGFTVPVSPNSIFDDMRGISTKIIRKPNGGYAFKDKRHKISIINIDANMLESCSVDQVMGVLLHEIGHSFNKILFSSKVWYKVFTWIFEKPSKFFFKLDAKLRKEQESKRDKRIQKAEAQINKKLADDSKAKAYLNIAEQQEEYTREESGASAFSGFIAGTIIASVILSMTIVLIPLAILSLTGLVKLAERYKGEIDADRFASQYGYSTGLSKNLIDSFSPSKTFKNIGIKADKGFIIELERKLRNFILAILINNEHPDNVVRVANSVKYLDDEIKSCKNPKIRKILQKQKKETLEVIKDYKNRLKKKDIDMSLDDMKTKWSYSIAGKETIEERAIKQNQ